jgi:hypothetical protein
MVAFYEGGLMKHLIEKLFNYLFPCGFNEPLCKGNFWGCRCGKNLFKSKKETPEVAVVADPYRDVREKLNAWLTGSTGIGQPTEQYKKELVAPMSKQEEGSLDWLEEYTKAGPSATRTAATAEIGKVLGGQYDPTTSPYYQAVKAEAARNLEKSMADIKDASAAQGRYTTGARISEQAESAKDIALGLNTVLGQLADQERQRMISVLPYASEFATAEEQAPLQKATALQSLGALPRVTQQAYDEAVYNEWLRSTQEWPLNIGQLSAGVQQAPLYGQTGYSPSMFSQLLGAIPKVDWSNLFSKTPKKTPETDGK